MNIQAYFALKLEGAILPDDIGALNMPCDSECGRDCMKAIDSASLMLEHIRAAMGDNWPFHARNIIFAAQQIVSIYICG